MLDLDLLHSFVSVVEAGGFTAAGERVHRSQSTVSQQIRKLEDAIMDVPESRESDPERPMWVAYVRHQVKRWQHKHPDDKRELRRVVLVRRRVYFPAPHEPIGHYEAPEESDIIAFTADGKVLP